MTKIPHPLAVHDATEIDRGRGARSPVDQVNPVDRINASQSGSLPGTLDFQWIELDKGRVVGRFDVATKHFSPHGLLHGATLVALADSACGFGCLASLPVGAIGFATGELKTNFVGTVREGGVSCAARLAHAGRTTQVWDAEIRSETTGKVLALFRCTQMLLYPPADAASRQTSRAQS